MSPLLGGGTGTKKNSYRLASTPVNRHARQADGSFSGLWSTFEREMLCDVFKIRYSMQSYPVKSDVSKQLNALSANVSSAILNHVTTERRRRHRCVRSINAFLSLSAGC